MKNTATTIDAAALSSLPVNGRDYRDFALLAPTARSITGTRGTFRVAGQPGDYLALNVDGADFTNSFFEGHRSSTGHSSHFGRRATQM